MFTTVTIYLQPEKQVRIRLCSNIHNLAARFHKFKRINGVHRQTKLVALP